MKRFHLIPFLPLVIGAMVACSHEIELVDLRTEAAVESLDTQITVLFSAKADTASVTVHSDGKWSVEAVNDRASSWLTYSPESGGKGDTRVKIDVSDNNEYEERTAVLHFRNGKNERIIQVVQKPVRAFLVSSEKSEFGPAGGQLEVTVTSNVNYTLTIEDAPWLHQIITKGVVDVLTFEVDPNDRADKRVGKLVFASELGTETVTVYQRGVKAEMILSENNIQIQSEGGQFRVDVASNFNAEYTIHADWIYEIATKSLSTNSFWFMVERNPDYDSRSAEIEFKDAEGTISGIVRVTQAQQDAIVAQNAMKVDYKSQTFDLTVSANVDVDVTVPEDCDWLSFVKTKGLTKRNLTFSIDKNSTKDIREADIILSYGDLRQSVRVSQTATTHLPESEKDWEESIEMTNIIAQKKEALFLSLENNTIESKINALNSIDEIVEVMEPTSESIVPVLQKDSMIVNIMLKSPVVHIENKDGLGASLSQNRIPSQRIKTGSLKSGKKALILAPFNASIDEPLDDYYNILKQFYEEKNIDTLKNTHADIHWFSGEKLSQYDIVLIFTHGLTGKVLNRITSKNEITSLMTSGTFYEKGLIKTLTKEGLKKSGLLIPSGEKKPRICMTADLLEDYSFNKALVFLGVCESAKWLSDTKPNPLIERFVRNKVLMVAGSEISINTAAANNCAYAILQYMSNGLSFQDAFRISTKTRVPVDWRVNYVTRYKTVYNQYKGVVDPFDESEVNLENYVYYPQPPKEDFFFISPFPTLAFDGIKDGDVLFSWSCNLPNSFDVKWKDWDIDWRFNEKDQKLHGWNPETRSFTHTVSYDVYIDGKPLDKRFQYPDYDRKAWWPITSSGEHSAYVVANITEGDNVLASYISNTVKFTITDLKITTGKAEDVSIKTASIPASYQSEYSFMILEEGVVYSPTNTEPTLVASDCLKQTANQVSNPFNTDLTGLEPLTKYYARAYMKVEMDETNRVFYGNVIEFTTDPIQNVVPPDILDELDDYIPIYEGINPPNVEGQYVMSPEILIYDSGHTYSAGKEFADLYFQFYNQDMENNTLDYREAQSSSTGTGTGAFISGDGETFSVFFNTESENVYSDYTVYTKRALILSGILTPQGIKDLKRAFVMVDKSSDPKHHVMDVGEFRILEDGDGLCSITNYFQIARKENKGFINSPSRDGLPMEIQWK